MDEIVSTDEKEATAESLEVEETPEPENGANVTWLAVYEDDSVLDQVGEDGKENGYGDIDRARLTEFRILDSDTKDPIFVMSLDSDQRLIYRRRVNMSGVTGEIMWVVYLVGWQKTVGGVNVQSLNWIMPDGSIINTGKYLNETSIFASVDLLDFEKKEYEEYQGEE